MDAALIAISFYILFMLFGIVAFFEYSREGSILSQLPVAIAALIGAALARFLALRRRTSVFQLLEPEISEMAQAAYDNREEESVVMQRLAEDAKAELSALHDSDILDRRRFNRRLGATAILALAALIIHTTHIGPDITPVDFNSITEIKDRILGSQKDTTSGPDRNATVSIYGKPSLAVLQESKLELQLYPGSGVGSISMPTNATDRLFQNAPPGQGVAVPSELYIESLPPNDREIVKRYFEALSTSSF